MLLCAIISLKLLSFFYFCNINSFLIISSACAFSVFISPTQRMGSRAFSSSVTPAASIIRGSVASIRSRATLVKADGDKCPTGFLFAAVQRLGYRAVPSRRASFFSPRRMLSHTRRRSAPSIRAISATVMPR